MTRPPIGLMPRWLHNELRFDDTSSENRLNEINEAINRYNSVKKAIPIEWIKEKADIIKKIK